ncbi:hypothetical protein [Paraburkholderia tropica]|uniref:Uncharacterized protein n=1 Tax=Paraburkholderia tropica TaxID=92647 RepID=A0AAQ1GG92_9BURK|nr:hypothetical protein [Paraburkholderia tropica]RQN40969.1 hypothetical protein EHZ25_01630 [Paraburkholderia tropica]SEJ77322.1 hypothetical protein SAMN05216550_108187 [Paraburkholderia tropica]
MSTYPLVQVEGALAMPHMRPLNRVPPPFGREWALIPPHFSLRTELHALYAALLRTACLSAEAFRKVCRWETGLRTRSETRRPAAAPVGATLNVAQAQQAAAAALQRKTASAPPAADASPLAPLERTPPRNHKLTATAVGIGGAAVLAWIVASHTQPGEHRNATRASTDAPASVPDNTPTNVPANALTHAPVSHDASASQRLAEARASHDLSYSGSVTAGAPKVNAPLTGSARITADAGVAASAIVVARQPDAAVAPSKTTSASSAPPAPLVSARPTEPRPPKAATVRAEPHDYAAQANPNTPLRATLSRKAEPASRASHTAKARHASVESRAGSARGDIGRHVAHEFAPLRSAPLATTQRAHGGYSTAEAYSPRQPSIEAANDYTSITTYAVTHAAPASRASAPVDSTDWVNHVSQRRVTEVPDRFSK